MFPQILFLFIGTAPRYSEVFRNSKSADAVKKYFKQYIRIVSQDEDSSVLVGPWVEHILLKLLELSVGNILLSVHSSCTTSEHLRTL
jgi:hypothetical protein